MAIESVATKQPVHEDAVTECPLFLGCGSQCVTVTLDRASKGFPPSTDGLATIRETIGGLGHAVGILSGLLDGVGGDTWSIGRALEAIADSIVMHVSLADGIHAEIEREPTVSEAQA